MVVAVAKTTTPFGLTDLKDVPANGALRACQLIRVSRRGSQIEP